MPREGFGERLPFDTRMLQKMQKSPQMMAEQGSGFLSDWGGPSGYIAAVKMGPNTREVYYAVVDGYTDPSQIEVATGLSSSEVSKGMRDLERKGLVVIEEVKDSK